MSSGFLIGIKSLNKKRNQNHLNKKLTDEN